jgi:pantothenate kinase type III
VTADATAVLVSIGNSRTATALLLADGTLAEGSRVATSEVRASSIGGAPLPVHLVSVVDSAAERVAAGLRAEGRTVTWWGREHAIPMRHPYRAPAAPGADRLVAALAAHRRAGGPCVVVDAGTAVTVDVVDADGAFLGGSIGPGFAALAESLRARAPALPAPRTSALPVYPARSTEDAVTLGVHAAFGAPLRELVSGAMTLIGVEPLFVTGGDAAAAARELQRLRPIVVPGLVLEGLAALAAAP